MNWQPIESYDALEKKPKFAAFWFEGTPPYRGSKAKYGLVPIITLERNFGMRICRLWIELPEPPK